MKRGIRAGMNRGMSYVKKSPFVPPRGFAFFESPITHESTGKDSRCVRYDQSHNE